MNNISLCSGLKQSNKNEVFVVSFYFYFVWWYARFRMTDHDILPILEQVVKPSSKKVRLHYLGFLHQQKSCHILIRNLKPENLIFFGIPMGVILIYLPNEINGQALNRTCPSFDGTWNCAYIWNYLDKWNLSYWTES